MNRQRAHPQPAPAVAAAMTKSMPAMGSSFKYSIVLPQPQQQQQRPQVRTKHPLPLPTVMKRSPLLLLMAMQGAPDSAATETQALAHLSPPPVSHLQQRAHLLPMHPPNHTLAPHQHPAKSAADRPFWHTDEESRQAPARRRGPAKVHQTASAAQGHRPPISGCSRCHGPNRCRRVIRQGRQGRRTSACRQCAGLGEETGWESLKQAWR